MSLSQRDTYSTFNGRSASASLSARSAPERRNAGSTCQIQPGRVRAMKHSLPDEILTHSSALKAPCTKANSIADIETLKEENITLKKRVVELEDERIKIKTRLTICNQRLQDKDDENQSLLEQLNLLESGDAKGLGSAKSASTKSMELMKRMKAKIKILETNLAEAEVKLQKSYNTEYSLRHEELEVMNLSYQNEIRRLQALIDSRYVEHTRGKLLELESDNALLSRELFDLVNQKKETDAKVVDSGKKVEHLQYAMDLLEQKMKEDAAAYETKYQKALSNLVQENKTTKEMLLSNQLSIKETMSNQWHQIQALTTNLTQYFNRELEVTKNYYDYKIEEMKADFQQKMRDKEDEKQRLLNEIQSRDNTIEGLNKTINGLQTSIESLNLTAGQLQKSIDSANQTIADLNEMNRQYQVNLNMKDKTIENLHKDIDQKKAEILDDIKKINGLESDCSDLKRRLDHNNKILQEKEEKLQKSEDTIKTCEGEIETHKKDLGETTTKLRESEVKLAETKNEVVRLRDEIDKRQQTITALEVEKNEYSEKLSDMKNKLEDAESTQQSLRVEKETLEKLCSEQGKQLSEAQDKINNLNHRIESYKKETIQLQSKGSEKVEELTRVQDYLEYARSLVGEDDAKSVMSYQKYHKSKGYPSKLRFDFQASSVHSGITPVGSDGSAIESEASIVNDEVDSQITRKSKDPPLSSVTHLETIADGKLQEAYNQKQVIKEESELPGETVELPKKVNEPENAAQVEERVDTQITIAKECQGKDRHDDCVAKLEELISSVDMASIKELQRHTIYSTLAVSYRHLLNFQKSIEVLNKSITITKAVNASIQEMESERVKIEGELSKNKLDDLIDLAQTHILRDEAEAEEFINKWASFLKESGSQRLQSRASELTDLPLRKLHMACRLGLANYCQKLVETCNVNELDKFGCTALHEAVRASSKECVEILLSKSADPNIASNQLRASQTCIYLVQELDILNLLLEKGADAKVLDGNKDTPLQISAGKGQNEISRKLIEKEVNVNNTNKMGRTALHEACKNDHEPIVTLLIEHGADINKADSNGNTPLMEAVENENEDIVSLLIEHNVSLTEQNNEGKTALHIAVSESLDDIVRTLLGSKYAPKFINTSDNKKQTALHIAIAEGDEDIAVMLAEKGADLDRHNADNKKPLELTEDEDLKSAVRDAAENT